MNPQDFERYIYDHLIGSNPNCYELKVKVQEHSKGYKVEFTIPAATSRDGLPLQTYVFRGKCRGLEHSFRNKVMPMVRTTNARVNLLKLCRDSGLIPKSVTKDVKTMCTEFFGRGWMNQSDALSFVTRHLSKWIMTYAVCPSCGAHETFDEDVAGWQCQNCGQTWVDMRPRESHWLNPVLEQST